MRTPMPWKQSVASLILRTTECCWRQGPSRLLLNLGYWHANWLCLAQHSRSRVVR
jgi:hypothetical protein